MAQSTVLIVEDEIVIAMELEDRLQTMGYAVMGSASSGASALQKIETTQPDVVLMDINIRGPKDGIETADEIRTRYAIPVIYLTAYADTHTLQRAKATVPAGYLTKPFREEELRATIEMAIYKHSADNDVREWAYKDALTGLYNRRYLNETLPRELHRALRAGSTLSVVMLDIDLLKMINDTYGHQAGDHMIQLVAGTVQKPLRKSDLVCRYGGDEIAILLPDTGLDDATRKMGEIVEKIRSTPLCIGALAVPITVSVGLAAAPKHADDAGELLHAADQALYLSKRAGRDRLTVAG